MQISVVIPTYQRKETVKETVQALATQTFKGPFEVIVVVDGSTDGTADALRHLAYPFPLMVVEQANQGAAQARNMGARRAAGDIILFIDDDMMAHPGLLAEHARSHEQGWNAVLGHIPLHPESPSTLLSVGIEKWADARAKRLTQPDAQLTLHDLLTGQLSVTRPVFEAIGGFDTGFTAGGAFGNEDIDFGYRLLEQGYRVHFNPHAISWQKYVVTPERYLVQWHQTGQADVRFARKYPEEATRLFELNGANMLANRCLWRPIQFVPPLARFLSHLVRWPVRYLLQWGRQDRFTRILFKQAVAAAYWHGVHKAGGILNAGSLCVLAYHAITDDGAFSPLEPYCLPPERFEAQIDVLLKAGYIFISADEFINFLQGGAGLPRKALFLTFDDCYTDLRERVLPILKPRGIPATAFAVSKLLGKSNEWDRALGGPRLALEDGQGLLELSNCGVEIGAHSRTHPPLTTLNSNQLEDEIRRSLADLEGIGLPRPRLFAYPHGESNALARKIARQAGLQAALTISPGRVRRSTDPYRLPRIEVLREDTPVRLLRKIRFTGRGSTVLFNLQQFGTKLNSLAKRGRKAIENLVTISS